MNAPVCPVNINQLRGMPLPFGLAQQIAALPRATDLKSAITVLNMMETIIQQITYTPPVINNIGQQPDYSGDSIPGVPGVFLKFGTSNWTEDMRDYAPRRVHNTDDLDQYVEIKVLGSVGFSDTYGHSLQYQMP